MTKNEKREHGDVLYEAILTLKDLEECKKFFSDLCTVAELRLWNSALRWPCSCPTA